MQRRGAFVKNDRSFYAHGMPRVSDAHRDARRRQILDAARACFIRDGFHATSMADVLAEAGLSAGAVYRYFPGKSDIVLAIASEAVEQLCAAWEHVLAAPALPPLEDALAEVLLTIERLDHEHGTPQLAVQVWAEAVRSPAMADVARLVIGRIRGLAVQLVERYQERGDIAADVPSAAVARVIVGLLPGFVLQRVLIGDVAAEEFRIGLRALLGASA